MIALAHIALIIVGVIGATAFIWLGGKAVRFTIAYCAGLFLEQVMRERRRG